MLKRKHMIIGFLAFCLVATLLIGVTSSAEYDPWCDINDDGVINILDIVNLGIRFGTEGTPINKTELLLTLLDRVDRLEARISELEGKPKIITVADPVYPNETLLSTDAWVDLLSVPNVTVSQGTNVLAIASGCFYCMEVTQSPLVLRHRANDTYGEDLAQGFTLQAVHGTARETIEIHNVWTNLTAGTYSFAIQYYVYPTRQVYGYGFRFSLLVF